MCLIGGGLETLQAPEDKPLIGYRGYNIGLGDSEQPSLFPLYFEGVVTPLAVAACQAGVSAQSDHQAPALDCDCGIYAYSEKSKTTETDGLVWAEVALWGTVIRHQNGYRAQYSRVLRMAISNGPHRTCTCASCRRMGDVPSIAERYGATLVSLEELVNG